MNASLAPRALARWLIVVVIGALFAVPIVAMLEFTLRNPNGGHSLVHWIALFNPANAAQYQIIWVGVGNSLQLVVVTVAIVLLLLAPTMILVHLRFPRLRRVLEFICLLPISIPAIVLVVGFAPIYLIIGRMIGTGIWPLGFAYGVTVLPYAFRSIQANLDGIDATTLAEAARSLGASWWRVITRVLVPNLRQGLLSSALISVAVVLGEYTIASLLNRQNLQTVLVLVNKQDPYISIILTLLTLLLGFLLLAAIGGVSGSGRRARRAKKGWS
ncbi:MAG: ABC transporter permease subunit [Pseudoclavibacter sp.]